MNSYHDNRTNIQIQSAILLVLILRTPGLKYIDIKSEYLHTCHIRLGAQPQYEHLFIKGNKLGWISACDRYIYGMNI